MPTKRTPRPQGKLPAAAASRALVDHGFVPVRAKLIEVAAFLDPLGNATHTALSFDLVGEDVLITGAGPIGIMAAAVAKAMASGSLSRRCAGMLRTSA